MKVDISRNDQISVQYYPTHYGHTAEPPLQAPASSATGNSVANGELIEQPTVQQQTMPPIQTVVHSAVQQIHTTATTDHCVRLQHQHHTQTSSIIINIAPVSLLLRSNVEFREDTGIVECEMRTTDVRSTLDATATKNTSVTSFLFINASSVDSIR